MKTRGAPILNVSLLGDSWLNASVKRKIDWILNGAPGVDFQLNVNLFLSVQSFISQSHLVLFSFFFFIFFFFSFDRVTFKCFKISCNDVSSRDQQLVALGVNGDKKILFKKKNVSY